MRACHGALTVTESALVEKLADVREAIAAVEDKLVDHARNKANGILEGTRFVAHVQSREPAGSAAGPRPTWRASSALRSMTSKRPWRPCPPSRGIPCRPAR